MKNKWTITLVIINIVLIISLISIISIWLFNKEEENQATSAQQEEITESDTYSSPAEDTKTLDDSGFINKLNSKYGSKYELVVSIETDSKHISQVKKVMVNVGVVKLDEMNQNNQRDKVYEELKNVRDDIVTDFGQVSVTFRADRHNEPFYMFDTEGKGHQID